MEKINTINNICESKLKEKGSLFIGIAKPVESVEEAENYLHTIKKQFYDATHHCYAYKIYPNIIKYSDDGEPNGTAGIRLLNAINHFDLINLILISIRYFGGIKLGVGPLGKAYYNNGIETLQNCKIISKELYLYFNIDYTYPLTKTVHYLLNKYNCKIINTEYSQNSQQTEFIIKYNLKEQFTEELINLTESKAELKSLNKSTFISIV